jgi:hypothetical protein
MPCYSGPYPTGDCDFEDERLDRATRVACELSHILRGDKQMSEISKDTKEWIQEHDALDARRIAAEEKEKREQKLRKVALAKLTKEEQVLLGLKDQPGAKKRKRIKGY